MRFLLAVTDNMYNGIGLTTPRGSGTNGYVQRNIASIRHRREKVDYKTDADLQRLDKALHKQPNKEILDHEWKRGIELKCLQLREELEGEGWVDPNMVTCSTGSYILAQEHIRTGS